MVEVKAPTEEEMEAYRMKRMRADDPMSAFMKSTGLEVTLNPGRRLEMEMKNFQNSTYKTERELVARDPRIWQWRCHRRGGGSWRGQGNSALMGEKPGWRPVEEAGCPGSLELEGSKLQALQSLVENRQWVSSDTTHFAIYEEYVDRVLRRCGDGDGVVLETNWKDPGLQVRPIMENTSRMTGRTAL
ncbi:SLU7 [Cordylochernes scorpioides]|uniref:SLU7 n=1 Tax=Cordylochernes scorpioides TaxID=51811 RepID=A0ABY6LEB3_9ARAC|nr:SLU7 [Cordylochernes scorpioides]